MNGEIPVCPPINFVIQSESMKTILRSVAALELLFMFPAALFMSALFARSVLPFVVVLSTRLGQTV